MPDRDTVISRIETICEICKTNKWQTVFDSDTIYPILTDALALLKEQPEIIRCGDCLRGEKLPMLQHYPNLTWCNRHSTAHNDDWFCADGERRGSE